MKITSIPSQQDFTGKLVVVGPISKSQNYLLGLHRENLLKMIKDKPYDLFVRQSKSKKTILITTDKNPKNGVGYVVRKNKQNFEEIANYVIQNKDSQLEKERKMTSEICYEYAKRKFTNSLFNMYF